MRQGKLDKLANKFEEDILGIEEVRDGASRIAFLSNVKTTTLEDDNGHEISALLCYFYDEEGNWFRSYIHPFPYFYVRVVDDESIPEVTNYLFKIFDQRIIKIEQIEKLDLDDVRHMAGHKSKFIKLSFRTTSELVRVRREIKQKMGSKEDMGKTFKINPNNILSAIVELREYDVLYHTRVMIDFDIRVGNWYRVDFGDHQIRKMTLVTEEKERPDFVVLAYDIETTKLPLKFPDPKLDQVILISYVIDGDGFLITNREVISEDIQNFEYIPNEEFETDITVFNEPNEKALLIKFIDHIQKTKPFIITTFNGDFFDYPFIEARMEHYGLQILEQMGIRNIREGREQKGNSFLNSTKEYLGRYMVHLDCFPWVKRDSYLPQGSQGLKAVTREKLYYEPNEVDPELMVQFATEKPKVLCNYSVSDAVATYYLYMKHIHDFIFALCTIIPLGPDDVLRRGSGTLCENLLMAEAYRRGIIFPNKIIQKNETFYNGHLIDSETYIGGKVECLHNGIYRSDLETNFEIDPSAYETLMNQVGDVIKFCVEEEQGRSMDDLTNFSEVKNQIMMQLSEFSQEDNKKFISYPLIYHVDVAAMYPNIILTNRLQPVAIVDEKTCASCIFNDPISNCKRDLEWQWKGEYFPLSRGEYENLKLRMGQVDPTQLKMDKIKERVKQYSRKKYKTIHQNVIELKRDTVCMRENPFYVDTVRDFRDRRYEFKRLVKKFAAKFRTFNKNGDAEEAKSALNMKQLYDSLQLAHKIILNSFYGYVMRRGSRWYSMEMAAMVTHTGAEIIKKARDLFISIGKPLELDTDGVWTLLPSGFPENFDLKFKDGSSSTLEYPCSISNLLIYDLFKNQQYQSEKKDQALQFQTRTEMTIFFELDGPYKAMVIPAALEEGKTLKKRYVVFDLKNRLSEVKGFEIKRRGELKIIKIFQKEIFEQYLMGKSLKECYAACAKTAEKWLNILISEGGEMHNQEIIDLIGESKTLSKNLSQYGAKKGVALTAARRMTKFLGPKIVEGSSLACKFIISREPSTAAINERAIPLSIFKMKDQAVKMKLLREWTKDRNLESSDLRAIVDWQYYKERLGKTIQKMVTITAAYQQVENPIPLIPHPKWLKQKLRKEKEGYLQQGLGSFFAKGTVSSLMVKKKPASQSQLSLAQQLSRNKEKEEQEKPLCSVSMEQNFPRWLQEQKKLWAFRRKKRKQGQLYKTQFENDVKDLDYFLADSQQNLKMRVWNILGIQPTEEKGVYQCWIHVDGTILAIKISIQREIFVHSTKKSKTYKKVSKVLPRNKAIQNLSNTVLSEDKFQKAKIQLERFLISTSYEGIYQTKVDLRFHAYSIIGNCCKLRLTADLDIKGNWNLSDMVSQGITFSPVQETELFVYCGVANFMSNQLYMLINHKLQSVHVLLAHSKIFPNHSELVSSVKRLLIAQVPELGNYDYSLRQSASVGFLLEGVMKAYSEKSKDKFLIAIQSTRELENLTLLKPFLGFYLARTVKSREMSSLNWHTASIETLCDNFAFFQQNLQERIQISQEIKCPLEGIPASWVTFATDLLYSRILRENSMISWASSGARPDLGLADDDMTEGSPLEESLDIKYRSNMKVSFCENIVAEVDLQNFELNLLFCHEELMKLDKDYSRILASNNDGYLNDHPSPTQAFNVITVLVKKIYQRLRVDPNQKIGTIIENITKWVYNPQSQFYDPELMKLFNLLLSKNFEKLIKVIKEQGGNIVDITTSRMLIDTGKKTLVSAREYTSFLLKQMRDNPLFQIVTPGNITYWGYLIYKDKGNFAGYNLEQELDQATVYWQDAVCLPLGMRQNFIIYVNHFVMSNLHSIDEICKEDSEVQRRTQGEGEDHPYLSSEVMMLQIQDSLYSKVKSKFIMELMGEIENFILDSKEKLRELEAAKELGSLPKKSIAKVEIRTMSEYDDIDSYDDSFVEKDDINSSEEDLKVDFNGEIIDDDPKNGQELLDFESPNVPGLYESSRSPLELMILLLGDVFYSVPFLEQEMHVLWKKCGNIIEKRKNFIIDGLFILLTPKDMSTIDRDSQLYIEILLEGILCSSCSKIWSIDLFKELRSEGEQSCWQCECGDSFSSELIEARVIEWVNKHLAYYNYQDLYCSNCKMVRVNSMLQLCSHCGGKMQTDSNVHSFANFKKEAESGFTNLRLLAQMCNMELLEVIIHLLSIISTISELF